MALAHDGGEPESRSPPSCSQGRAPRHPDDFGPRPVATVGGCLGVCSGPVAIVGGRPAVGTEPVAIVDCRSGTCQDNAATITTALTTTITITVTITITITIAISIIVTIVTIHIDLIWRVSASIIIAIVTLLVHYYHWCLCR